MDYTYSVLENFIKSPLNNDLYSLPYINDKIRREFKAKNISLSKLMGFYLLVDRDTNKFENYLNTFSSVKESNVAKSIATAIKYKSERLFM